MKCDLRGTFIKSDCLILYLALHYLCKFSYNLLYIILSRADKWMIMFAIWPRVIIHYMLLHINCADTGELQLSQQHCLYLKNFTWNLGKPLFFTSSAVFSWACRRTWGFKCSPLKKSFGDLWVSNFFERLTTIFEEHWNFSPFATSLQMLILVRSPTLSTSPFQYPAIPKICTTWKCYADLYWELQLSVFMMIILLSSFRSTSFTVSSMACFTETWSCLKESKKYGL